MFNNFENFIWYVCTWHIHQICFEHSGHFPCSFTCEAMQERWKQCPWHDANCKLYVCNYITQIIKFKQRNFVYRQVYTLTASIEGSTGSLLDASGNTSWQITHICVAQSAADTGRNTCASSELHKKYGKNKTNMENCGQQLLRHSQTDLRKEDYTLFNSSHLPWITRLAVYLHMLVVNRVVKLHIVMLMANKRCVNFAE